MVSKKIILIAEDTRLQKAKGSLIIFLSKSRAYHLANQDFIVKKNQKERMAIDMKRMQILGILSTCKFFLFRRIDKGELEIKDLFNSAP